MSRPGTSLGAASTAPAQTETDDARAETGLLVYVPGLGGGARGDAAALLDRLRHEFGAGWRIECWDHGLQPWSTQRMEQVAHRLAVRIRTWAGDADGGPPVGQVVLIGHSVGGLLVRHAFLHDAGCASHPQPREPWTTKVSRMVLLAAPNAGFDSERLPLPLRIPYALIAPWQRLTVSQLQSGSAYITELRLRWVTAFRDEPLPHRPVVVQVLGDRDDVVSAADSMDVEYMADATRLDVPDAGHRDLPDLDSALDPEERYGLLRQAVRGAFHPSRLKPCPTSKEPVYLLLHGIRTSRYSTWVGDLTRAVSRRDPAALVHAPSYGYFSAIDFALPLSRRKNLRQFMNWYSQMHVTHAEGTRSFAGHSNGTYLLGQALLAVPAMRFDRIYLAGSVLPREYPWSMLAERGQVGRSGQPGCVHSDRATADRPVGWLCSALRGLGMRDVGTAGVFGFDDQPAVVFEHDGACEGGHGAALLPRRMHHVAEFLADGKEGADPGGEPTYLFGLVSRLAGVVSLPVAAVGTFRAARWVLDDGSGSRLLAAGVASWAAWAVGRSV